MTADIGSVDFFHNAVASPCSDSALAPEEPPKPLNNSTLDMGAVHGFSHQLGEQGAG